MPSIGSLQIAVVAAAALAAGLVAFAATEARLRPASVASREGQTDPCHRARTCPSEHATYRWRGLLCVRSTAPERTSAYRLIYVHSTNVYYCKR